MTTPNNKLKGKISFGLSSYGLMPVPNEFKIFTNAIQGVFQKFLKSCNQIGRNVILQLIALARTIEYFKIPEDVLVICLGKSTYKDVELW